VGPEGRVKIEVATPGAQVYIPIVVGDAQFQMLGTYVFTLAGQDFEGASVPLKVSQRTAPRVH